MKTKAFLVACLFLGIGLSQLAAQNGKAGTGSISLRDVWYCPMMPVYCEGQVVDYIEGTIDVAHWVVHFNLNNFQWQKSQVRGEITSTSGEVFEVNSVGTLNLIKIGLLSEFHMLLKGNRGSHFVLSGTMTCDGEYEFDKAICN